MFENLEKPFKFCSVSLLKTEDVYQQFTANMVRYVKYCENELNTYDEPELFQILKVQVTYEF